MEQKIETTKVYWGYVGIMGQTWGRGTGTKARAGSNWQKADAHSFFTSRNENCMAFK